MKKILFIALSLVILAGCGSVSTENTTDFTGPFYNMVFIPEGNFKMGCNPDHNGGFSCLPDELPLHTVKLDGYYIDKFEVTNAQYAACVKSEACESPSDFSSETQASYFDKSSYANYPVVYVSWNDAEAYCKWAGKRLPTEAEWEKAARGSTVKTYPWGDKDPSCTLANVYNNVSSSDCVGDTSAVGSLPDGASQYGALDMAGNVWEWVSDWYSENYYNESPSENPTGPASSAYKVLRGGGWSSNWVVQRTASRSFDPDFNKSKDAGFRCASSSDGD
jgi:formylglycine-generating enzyme required for sulfatase activity